MKNWTGLLNPQGDAIHLMKQHAGRLLLVQYRDHHGLLSLDDNGATWADNRARLLDWHSAVAAGHAAAIAASDVVASPRFETATGYLRRARSRRGFEKVVQDAVGGAFLHMQDSGDIPQGLTVCQEEDLDRDPRYLGCTNGVVDLNVGRLLPAEEGRRQLISRNTGVSFEPEALDVFVDDLLARLSEPERRYLLSALGSCPPWGEVGSLVRAVRGTRHREEHSPEDHCRYSGGCPIRGVCLFPGQSGLMVSGRHTGTARFANHLRDFTRGRIALGDDLHLRWRQT